MKFLPKYKTLFTTVSAMQLFQVMRLGALIGSSVVLAKSGLSTGDIGSYELLLYVGTTLSFFWVNGLLQGLAPLYGLLEEEERKPFIFNQFVVFSLFSLCLFGVLFLGKSWVLPLLTGQSSIAYFPLFCLFWLFNLPAFGVEYVFLIRDKPLHIVVWGVVSALAQIMAVALPLWMGKGLENSLWALCLLAVAKYIFAFGLAWSWGEKGWHPRLMRRYLRFCLPLMSNVLMGNFVLLFDNWLVGWYYQDEAIFALYRYGSREFPIAIALATALGAAIVPQLQRDWHNGLADLKQRSERLMLMVFPLTILVMSFSKTLFPLVFNSDFAPSAALFNIYLLLTASRVLLPNALVMAKARAGVILQVGIAELMVKIALGFCFIQWWGLPGLAWSAVIAYWVEKIGLMWYLEQKHKVKTHDWLPVRQYLMWVLALFGVFLLTMG